MSSPRRVDTANKPSADASTQTAKEHKSPKPEIPTAYSIVPVIREPLFVDLMNAPACAPPTSDSFRDLACLTRTMSTLESSNFYYGTLSYSQADAILRGTTIGTFLIRDSSDSGFLFALSVQTGRGPTSIRIHYENGEFFLDAEDRLTGFMPVFDCVVKLVNFYVDFSRTEKSRRHVWLNQSGQRDLNVCLTKPLLRATPSLQHLCRLKVNMCLAGRPVTPLALPKAMKSFVNEYPHSL